MNSTTLTVLRRELMAYCESPIGYGIAVLFYLCRGVEVSNATVRFAVNQVDLDLFAGHYLLMSSSYFMIVLVPPILTMRSFAEEKRTGSLELLMTAPVRDLEVVLGKFAAAWLYFSALWLPTLAVLAVLGGKGYLATEFEMGPVAAGYLGLLGLGSMFLSVGMFTSSLTENQLLASLSSMIFNYAVLAIPGYLTSGAPLAGVTGSLVGQIDIPEHLMGWFFRGLVATDHVVFYASTTVLFLFLTVRSVESRKWR
jgi:ABC-2 type transport system permease protein